MMIVMRALQLTLLFIGPQNNNTAEDEPQK